jgi:hypothetical protein
MRWLVPILTLAIVLGACAPDAEHEGRGTPPPPVPVTVATAVQ